MRSIRALCASVGLLVLAGCAGPAASSNGGFGGSNHPIPAGCPTQSPDDVWADVRLACFTVGEPFIDVSKDASGDPADTAYIMVEQAFDDSFSSINGGKRRYFEYILCVKQAPANIEPLSLATDFAVANGLGNFGWALPKGISTATTSISGSDATGPSRVVTPCDPAVHPVIVDFPSGKIESINPGALANLKTTDS